MTLSRAQIQSLADQLEHSVGELPSRQRRQLEDLLIEPKRWTEPDHPQAAAALFRKGLAERTDAFERYRDDTGKNRVRYYWSYRPLINEPSEHHQREGSSNG